MELIGAEFRVSIGYHICIGTTPHFIANGKIASHSNFVQYGSFITFFEIVNIKEPDCG
jgi:hypothetical protein